MIEFRGYISGAAEKRFVNKCRRFGQFLSLAAFAFAFPFVLHVVLKMKFWALLSAYAAMVGLSLILSMFTITKKSKGSILPKRIYTDEDCIVCVADTYVEHKLISDVKEVRDFGEFYDIIFPFGKYSEKFICQKNLLTVGTIEEFEKIFEGKIVRKL